METLRRISFHKKLIPGVPFAKHWGCMSNISRNMLLNRTSSRSNARPRLGAGPAGDEAPRFPGFDESAILGGSDGREVLCC